jgi:hypothetical protein
MIDITERSGDVLISTVSGGDSYIKKGMARVAVVNGEFVLFSRKTDSPTSKTPLLKINKLSQVGTVTDAAAASVVPTSIKDLAEKISDFFV